MIVKTISSVVVTFTANSNHNLNEGDLVRLENVGDENPYNNKSFYVRKLSPTTVSLFKDAARTIPALGLASALKVSSSTDLTWSTSKAALIKLTTTSVSDVVYSEFPENWAGYDYPITWINSSVTVTWKNGGSTIKWIRHI